MNVGVGDLVKLSSRPGREFMVLRLKEDQKIEARLWPLHSAPNSFETTLADVISVRRGSDKGGL